MGLRRAYQGVPGSVFITNTQTPERTGHEGTRQWSSRGSGGRGGVLHTPPPPTALPPCPTAQTHALPMGEDLMSGAGNAHNVLVRFKSRLKTACNVCSQC